MPCFRFITLLLILSLACVPVSAGAQLSAALSGRVVDSFGEPIAGVAVEATSVSGYRQGALTRADGVFVVAPLVAGDYVVTFTADGYAAHSAAAVIGAAALSLGRVVLPPAVPAAVSGVVVDDQGLALPGAVVSAQSPGEPALEAVTDAAGRFAFEGVRPGSWRVFAALSGFESDLRAVDVAFGQQAELRLALALAYQLAEEVVVVGSRRRTEQRTVSDSPVPVDVLTAADFVSQPRADMAELLRTLAPSFNVNAQPISDAATVVRPVNLRNLAPDHLLVLVNGKRRHRGAVISWLGSGVADGSQGPDVSVIPAIAVRQAELLRDGAAAQYGSDAIAGVVNFQLKDARDGGSIVLSTGTHLTPNSGDPATCSPGGGGAGYSHSCSGIGGRAGAYSFAGNVGLPLGSAGFANLSLEYGSAEPTNRAVQRADAQDLVDAGNTSVRDTAQLWGVPHVEDDLKAFVNLAAPAGPITPYAHANYARRAVTGGFYYRHPYTRGGVFRGPVVDGEPTLLVGDRLGAASGGALSAACPVVSVASGVPDPAALAGVEASPDCFTLYSRFPGGFAPQFGGTLLDASVLGGVRYLRPDGFGWDLSAGLGHSRIDQRLGSSVNASLGFDTPTEFSPGSAAQDDVNFNFDVTVPLDGGFHFAAGAEWREEAFTLGPGGEPSWAIGPYADQGFSSGSNGFNGYRPDTAAGRWARSNIAFYGDLEHRDPRGRWTLGGALRAEHFDDFGSTLNSKAAARVALPAGFALRSAVSTGFRAPTPGQQNAFNVTTAFIAGNLVNRGVVPSTSAVALARGGSQLQPERSTHASVGLLHQQASMQFAVDAFVVDVSDRLALSQEISLSPSEVGVLLDEGIPEARNFPVFRFFVNDFGTATRGVDLTWTLRRGPHVVGALLNHTVTRLHSLAGTVIDRYRVATLEAGLPQSRWQLWARPDFGGWSLLARYQWYGSYWDSEDARNAAGLGVVEEPWLYPYYAGRGLVDLEATVALSDDIDVSVGAQNVFSVWPEENPHAALTVGNRYGQFSPFGFEGTYVYGRLHYRWGR